MLPSRRLHVIYLETLKPGFTLGDHRTKDDYLRHMAKTVGVVTDIESGLYLMTYSLEGIDYKSKLRGSIQEAYNSLIHTLRNEQL